MEKRGSILIVDDDEDILIAGKLLLKRHFANVVTISQPNHISSAMSKDSFDAILLDMNFGPGQSSGEEGFYWLAEILKIDPQAVVIMITAHGGVNIAVEAMKMGATDFVSKPWQNEKVVATLSAAVKLRKTRNEAATLREANRTLVEDSGSQQIIGKSEALKFIQTMIERAAPTDANVLIVGENGTGKELVARELHSLSNRAGQIFLSVDMGAISESLFDSELFGHKKGSFTDAKDDRVGRLQAASGGTLFLDEIGNLPLHLQAKLLTVLEQRKVTPVGSNQAVPFDVRVIAATNLTSKQLSDESRFRQDLLFRLNTVEITVPPLRERPEDIEEIANHYIKLYCRKYDKEYKNLSAEALAAIKEYEWPGNVR
ncbi:MAG: sigma-54-dependent Fis family transcriptional regulator, partial [Kordiimonadaceae bacterium]|nr:sigma-54-dependent Fis family transcriptional regulator [Kordiimonadaceae bacterium]